MLVVKLTELQQIVTCMKQELALKKSRSETSLNPKKIEHIKRKTRVKFVIPITLLVFVVIVLCSAVGILLFKVFDQTKTPEQSSSNPTNKVEKITPIYSLESNNENLLNNPSFEEVDSNNNLAFLWAAQDSGVSYSLLSEEGETKDNDAVYPFHGKKSLRLSLSGDSEPSGTVTQTLLIAENPKALNFSGWGNSDLFTPNSNFVPFMISVELEFTSFRIHHYTALFQTSKKGWQFSSNYIDNFDSDTLYAIHISCSISRGIGPVFFDDISMIFYN